jgi:hypothetical protein
METREKKQTNKYENIAHNKNKAAAKHTTNSPMCPLSTAQCGLDV